MSQLLDLIRRSNANGRVAPPESDTWAGHYDAATHAGQRAMALGARRRAEQLAASVEPDPEPEPDARAEFHDKNAGLLARITGRPATPNQEK